MKKFKYILFFLVNCLIASFANAKFAISEYQFSNTKIEDPILHYAQTGSVGSEEDGNDLVFMSFDLDCDCQNEIFISSPSGSQSINGNSGYLYQ